MSASSEPVPAVLHRDRLELSAGLLVQAFSDLRDEPLPSLRLVELTETFARRHGLPGKYRRVLAGLPQRDREASVLRLVLDLICSWSDAGLAVPLSSSADDGSTRVVLTIRGSEALRAPDTQAHAAVLGMLQRNGASRSFIE